MSDFELDIQYFMDGRLDDVVSDLEKKNEEYKVCKKDDKDSADKLEEVIDMMPKEDWDFIKKHEMNVFNIAVQNKVIFIIEAIRTVLNFLKHLMWYSFNFYNSKIKKAVQYYWAAF